MNYQNLVEVNLKLNKQITYYTDIEKYKVLEHWTDATKNRNQGDCEDYSIAKLHALLELGWPIELLRLTFCWVEKEAVDTGHAVLVVEYNNKLYCLDNRYDEVREVPDCTDYIWNTTQDIGGSQNWISCINVFSKFYQ